MGRKGYLDEDVKDRLVLASKAGSYLHEAAAYVGISERTLYDWMTRGRKYDEHLEGGGEIIEGEDIYRMMTFEIEQARAEARISAAGALRKAWQDGEWRAAIIYLERTDPKHWGRVQRVEMSGREGGPITVADVTDDDRRIAAALNERLAAAGITPELEAADDVIDIEVVDDEKPRATVMGVPDDEDEDWYPPAWPTSGEWFDR